MEVEHYKNKNFEITILLVCTVARNCNLIGRVGCYDCMVAYVTIIQKLQFQLSLYCLLDIQRSRITK